MAREKRVAKRVFFVRRNVDDVAAARNTMPRDPAALLAFYEGEFYGACGAGKDVCEGESIHFVRGWEMGHEGHKDAHEAFEKAREAGKKSAKAREEKAGTAQPAGGKGSATKTRTENRTPFDNYPNTLRQLSEHPSDQEPDEFENGSIFMDRRGYRPGNRGISELETELVSEGRSDY
jgi:hypothetical protein